MKNDFKNCIIIGFALFAMFFGAGNLIFPIYSGLVAGDSAPLAAIAFVLTGVGIPFLAILAGTKSGGSFENMASQVGKTFGVICTIVLMITIGPLVASPRTAATTFELALSPLVPSMSPVVGMIIFYAVNIALILKPSTIVDTIGKVLTPALLIILIILIVKGIISPIGPTTDPSIDSVFFTSLIVGYQTMDALTALAFSSIIISSIVSKGYAKKDIFKTTIKSGMISIVCLAIVYGGLVYVGHTASSIYPTDISKTQLLINISANLLGRGGRVLIGIAMALACLTTSMCLLSSAAAYFEDLSKGKLPYKVNVFVMCIISGIIGVLGVDKIVTLASPLLSILYPVCITLILLTLGKKFVKNNSVVKYSVYVALIFAVIDVFKPFGLNTIIPLSELGFGWVIPTFITFIICNFLIFNKKYTISDNLSKFEV
ncbi:branched-chain amino acid transport system II carrier protein [Clostridium frigidicarnis]|uniref:Branched-chain amino acid transport system carrier protein n=1 Tax=Clostridium frigidicarnis TaxID=84698 RepID=A0A1I1ADS5_9CLOT|nr:branched-chain amino acid transport system II carrier protein [Clostridium frigidicarnis]SFB35652.1 branched-chain amino acid:cation transporter, LIVCS family [Clostridium frigidicarnis]